VSLERARITYIPIGVDAPARFRWRWGTLNDALARSQADHPCLRVVCANFSRKATDFIICAQQAKGGRAKKFGTTFWFEAVNADELDSLKVELRGILQQCAAIQAQVLVLPELTMPEELIAELEDHCRQSPFPILTVAGSWHVKGRLNRCPVYAGPERMAVYEKMHRFTMPPAEVRDFVRHVPVQGVVDPTRSASEEIALGDRVVVIDSDVGRFAIAICIDAAMSELIHTYESLGVNYLFVPTRSSTVKRFTNGLRTFCEHCTAFVCLANTPSAVAQGESSVVLVPTRPISSITAGTPAGGRTPRACEEQHAVLEPTDFV
jgi:predicted amidohydrolase